MQPPVQGFWGKLDQETGRWHPLADHCADVAACCEVLLRQTILGPRLATLAGQDALSPVQVARLCVLAALHDAGKFSIGFQNKGLGASPTCGHLKEVLGLLGRRYQLTPRLHEALRTDVLASWGDRMDDLIVATISHHGRPVECDAQVDERLWQPARGLDPFAGIAQLVEKTHSWFPEAWGAPGDLLPGDSSFQHAWSGLLMLADWLGSDETFFPFSDSLSLDRMEFSRSRAAEALGDLGLITADARRSLGPEPPGFERVAPGLRPRAAQAALFEVFPAPRGGSATLLEAETGSGKTEAALSYFARLFHAGLVDGMYFALPTRTAATQIHRRARTAVEHLFPPDRRPPVVLAVPGYLEVDGVRGIRLPHFRVLWNDDDKERWRFRGWAAERPKRYLAGAVVVGTIDQALLSALMVSHAHLRGTALLRHLLVVDEVHASDTYMTRILETVLDHHLAAGGHALLMSATLGSAARAALLARGRERRAAQPPAPGEAARTPYPLISFRQDAARREIAPATSDTRQKHVRLDLVADLDEPEAIARRALAGARAGARVLVVRNTVIGCLAVQCAMEALASARGEEHLLFRCGDVVAPHHARFARADRRLLDDAIETTFGGSRAAGGGCAAVATQTVQQSLDLDADFLVTDLCPIDVLLQRIGRLHRHARPRPPGCEAAQAVVLVPPTPLADRIQPDGKPRGNHGLGSVYDDLRALEATWRTLAEAAEISIPADNRRLVEAALHPQVLDEIVDGLGEPWARHREYVIGRTLANRRQATLSLVRRDLPFTDREVLFLTNDLSRRIATRLGHEDRIARFDPPAASPFGSEHQIAELTIPHFWVAPETPPDTAQAEDVKADAAGLNFRYGSRVFRYDRLGLRPSETAGDHEED